MPEVWEEILKEEIKNAKKICIMGIGNIEKMDDGAGALAVNKISSLLKSLRLKNLILINGGTTPENFTGTIRKFKPSLTILIDACVNKEKPGTISIIVPDEIQFGDISTHRLPLSMLIKFLEETIPTKVIAIGIEPKLVDYGSVTPLVRKAIERFATRLVKIIRELKHNDILE
uniref:Hydrogenase maturation peptidase HycI n=1 Tax=candidate division WOR-3 bacterium TaxID=2052148 RepID=A0A7C4TE20_UNCW3